jgi:hypothetical protein
MSELLKIVFLAFTFFLVSVCLAVIAWLIFEHILLSLGVLMIAIVISYLLLSRTALKEYFWTQIGGESD